MRLRHHFATLALGLMITACAAPFSIHRLAPQQAQLQLTANVLTTGELSGFSEIVLRQYDLLDTYKKDPESALTAPKSRSCLRRIPRAP